MEFYFVRSQVVEQQNKIARCYKNGRTNKGLMEEKEPASTPQGSPFFCDEAACCVLVVFLLFAKLERQINDLGYILLFASAPEGSKRTSVRLTRIKSDTNLLF